MGFLMGVRSEGKEWGREGICLITDEVLSCGYLDGFGAGLVLLFGGVWREIPSGSLFERASAISKTAS